MGNISKTRFQWAPTGKNTQKFRDVQREMRHCLAPENCCFDLPCSLQVKKKPEPVYAPRCMKSNQRSLEKPCLKKSENPLLFRSCFLCTKMKSCSQQFFWLQEEKNKDFDEIDCTNQLNSNQSWDSAKIHSFRIFDKWGKFQVCCWMAFFVFRAKS